jgi:hypothetical protein
MTDCGVPSEFDRSRFGILVSIDWTYPDQLDHQISQRTYSRLGIKSRCSDGQLRLICLDQGRIIYLCGFCAIGSDWRGIIVDGRRARLQGGLVVQGRLGVLRAPLLGRPTQSHISICWYRRSVSLHQTRVSWRLGQIRSSRRVRVRREM